MLALELCLESRRTWEDELSIAFILHMSIWIKSTISNRVGTTYHISWLEMPTWALIFNAPGLQPAQIKQKTLKINLNNFLYDIINQLI